MSGHIVPLNLYYRIFGVLMFFTALTVGVAFLDLGFMNVFVAIGIAVVKAVLVILFFMHVRYGTRLTMIFASAGFVWLVIMIVIVLCDYMTRTW